MKTTGREMQGQGDDKHTIDSDDEVSVPSITDQPLDPLIAQLMSESSRDALQNSACFTFDELNTSTFLLLRVLYEQ